MAQVTWWTDQVQAYDSVKVISNMELPHAPQYHRDCHVKLETYLTFQFQSETFLQLVETSTHMLCPYSVSNLELKSTDFAAEILVLVNPVKI